MRGTPASTNCEKQGGLVESREGRRGTSTACLFPNTGTECETLSLLAGSCSRKSQLPKGLLLVAHRENNSWGLTYLGLIIDVITKDYWRYTIKSRQQTRPKTPPKDIASVRVHQKFAQDHASLTSKQRYEFNKVVGQGVRQGTHVHKRTGFDKGTLTVSAIWPHGRVVIGQLGDNEIRPKDKAQEQLFDLMANFLRKLEGLEMAIHHFQDRTVEQKQVSFVFDDDTDPNEAYTWLADHVLDLRLVPYDCDCFVIQVGSRVGQLTDKQRLAEYNKLMKKQVSNEELEGYGYLEQDWKGFDAIILDFINRFSQHARVEYTMDDMGQVETMSISMRTP